MNRTKRALFAAAAALLLGTASGSASAQASHNHTRGYITKVTFVQDYVMITVNGTLPGNCEETPWGWMKIPATSKAMTAFVIGLWMRGDAAQTTLSIYTDGLVDGGYCRISQIDPA